MPSPVSYGPVQRSLHWLVFLLVLGAYGLTYAEELFAGGTPERAAVWWLHISFGLLLVALVAWRLALRTAVGVPALPSSMSPLERRLAHGAHLLLYVLLVATPLIGILLAWFRGDAVSFFGLFTIPSLVAPDRDTARSIQELHELCADAILIVAGLHAAAALWHHVVRHDDVLRRMLPFGSVRPL